MDFFLAQEVKASCAFIVDNPHRPLLEAVKDTTGEEASLGRVEQRGQSWVRGTGSASLGEWNRGVSLG